MSKINRQGKQQVPKIRFDGFSGDWEQRTIASLSETTIGGGTPSTVIEKYWQGEIPWIQSSDLHIDNVLDISPTKKITENAIENSAARLIPKNSLAIVTRVGVGKLCFLPYEYATSQDFLSLVGLNINHLYATYSLYRFLQEEKNKVQGTAIKGLTKADLLSQKISVSPSIEEQTQIGNFFQQLDKLIELQTRAVESAETYKKAMLQKMFPQKGEKVPRVRFEGFSGDWVTTYFKDVADVRRGLTYSPSDVVTDKKGIRVLRSSNIDEDTLVISDTDVFVSEDAVKISYIKMNEILITAANGSSRLVGKHAIISKDLERAVHGGFMLAVSTSQPEFINSWMNGVQYKKMLQLVQGGNGAIGNLSRSMLEECKITLPCLVEQEKIGNFFQKLDQNIESEKKKLEQYQTMKRAMLQRMFV